MYRESNGGSILPKVSTFIYSEDASQVPDNVGREPKLVLVNPRNVFVPAYVPGMFSFAVTFGIVDLNMDTDHKLRYVFKGPSGSEKLLLDTGDISVPPNSGDAELPATYRGFMFTLNARNIEFASEGEYVSEVYIDSNKIGYFPVYVRGRSKHAANE